MIVLESRMAKRGSAIVFASAIILGLASFLVLYSQDQYSLIYYGDSSSHLFSAKRFVDAKEPGIGQLGTVWLPLPHIMFLPFSLVGSLFSSGIAGMLVCLPCHAFASILIYRIIKSKTSSALVPMIGALLYASNPNLIYLGITAMTEAPFLAFFLASAYFYLKWEKNVREDSGRLFLIGLSAFFVALATLCRYEAWVLAPLLVLLVATTSIRHGNGSSKKILAILLALVSFSGIAFWVLWNGYSYGDPLEFANSQFYSASSQAGERPYRDALYMQPINDLRIYGMAAFMIFGPVLLVLSPIGYFRNRQNPEDNRLYLFLLAPAMFTLLSLYIGIGEMSQWWFNARFATFLAPIVVVLSSLAVWRYQECSGKKIILAIMISGAFAFQLLSPLFGVVTFIDAYSGWIYKQTPSAVDAGEFLKENYDGTRIMLVTGSAQEHRMIQVSEIPLIRFDEGIQSYMSMPYFSEPWEYDGWVVIGSAPDSDAEESAKYWKENISSLVDHYSLKYENEYYKVYRIK